MGYVYLLGENDCRIGIRKYNINLLYLKEVFKAKDFRSLKKNRGEGGCFK